MVNRRRESTFGGGAGTAEAAPLAPATARVSRYPNGDAGEQSSRPGGREGESQAEG
jgi:hypothetical protein